MNTNLLRTLFIDNPERSSQVFQFLQTLPQYTQARRKYLQAARQVEAQLGFAQFCRLEALFNEYRAIENNACYLFGLSLRRDVLQALGPAL